MTPQNLLKIFIIVFHQSVTLYYKYFTQLYTEGYYRPIDTVDDWTKDDAIGNFSGAQMHHGISEKISPAN